MAITLKQTPNSEIGKKAENLDILKNLEANTELFKVPFYRSISLGQDTKNIKEEFKSQGIKKVSVRSSSNTEDTQDDSKAGAFKTFLNVDIDEIDSYVEEIQSHSRNKFGYEIPIIIQEMVHGTSGVAFSVDPDSGKEYFVLNYHEGLGEELVSGNINGKTSKIFSNGSENYINDSLHLKLYKAVSYIKSKVPYDEIDIEFVSDGENLYLLQVRPITKVSSKITKTSKLAIRYVNLVSRIIKSNNLILGDMIDINPEELVGNKPILIKTFFSHIFPESSLGQARQDLGYKYTDNFLVILLDKTYVDLSQNIISFLPNTLTEEETQIFVDYYRNLIENNPELQNQLDSQLYPNSIEKVVEILENLGIDEGIRRNIINKFETFFVEFGKKIETFAKDYFKIEKSILNKVGVSSFYELLKIDHFDGTLKELLDIIKETTYYFSIFARIFFFTSNAGNEENHDFFKNNIYTSLIDKSLKENSESQIHYSIAEGFNFFSQIPQTFYTGNGFTTLENADSEVGAIDIGKIGRENLKFLFMNLFRLLGNKIFLDLNKRGLSQEDVENLNFGDLIDFLEGNNISDEKLRILINKGKVKSEISNSLEFPSVINSSNNLIDNTLLGNSGFFSGKGIMNGEICIINDISEFQTKDYKGKIIVIENATPEIDIYLRDIKGIITKNGGPLAHIMIRARELDIPAVVGTSKYIEIITSKTEKVNIDFNSKQILF